jgi:hypothetical protein
MFKRDFWAPVSTAHYEDLHIRVAQSAGLTNSRLKNSVTSGQTRSAR